MENSKDETNCLEEKPQSGLAGELANLSLNDEVRPWPAKERTGLVYDDRMKRHVNIWDKNHSEVPDRIGRPYEKHKEYGLLDRCYKIPSRHATEEDLLCLHSKEHIDKMKSTKDMKPRDLFNLGEEYDSIYMSKDVYDCALLSCGCTLAAVEHVATNKVQNAVAIVRPPGHHADADSAMGYCFFNNVAIAAKLAQQRWGMQRILIVDWDIHHGNGTQNLFESDPSVLYFSLHRYDHANFYPFSAQANYDIVGKGQGKGFNVNVPWNKSHIGDADYIAAFQQILLPIAYEFDPDIVLVSAGFDSARGDPKGYCDITPEGYCHLTNMLMSLAGGKVVVILEGGYNITSVAESMCSCTSTLLGDPCPRLDGPMVPCQSVLKSISNVVNVHKQFWKNLTLADAMNPEMDERVAEEEKLAKERRKTEEPSEDEIA
ncbi:histone deacetylase 6 isoform X1 [Nematostella vectensis]|uniref:histone deacetylase 6 isoform X1 n=1 Tax=Nematostella vectensis TaxID=45351 RepID=UPI0020779466|nr:histone deacetylase 6 isoform X1 [Nematostella vectensis]